MPVELKAMLYPSSPHLPQPKRLQLLAPGKTGVQKMRQEVRQKMRPTMKQTMPPRPGLRKVAWKMRPEFHSPPRPFGVPFRGA